MKMNDLSSRHPRGRGMFMSSGYLAYPTWNKMFPVHSFTQLQLHHYSVIGHSSLGSMGGGVGGELGGGGSGGLGGVSAYGSVGSAYILVGGGGRWLLLLQVGAGGGCCKWGSAAAARAHVGLTLDGMPQPL